MTASPVEARWSYRKFRMRRVYLGLALLVIGAPLLIGTNMFRKQSPLVIANLPTAVLLHLATSGDHPELRDELFRRVRAGEYTGLAADRIAERLLEVQTKPFFPLGPLADSLYTLVDDNALSPELAALAEQRLWTFHLNLPAQVRPGARIPIEVTARYRGPRPGRLTAARGGVSFTSMVFQIEHVVIGGRKTDLSDRNPVYKWAHSAMQGLSMGMRYSLPQDDPVLNAIFTAPMVEGKCSIEVAANWRIQRGFPYKQELILSGDFLETKTVTVTSTPQPLIPAP
jgi:hypothetical protein